MVIGGLQPQLENALNLHRPSRGKWEKEVNLSRFSYLDENQPGSRSRRKHYGSKRGPFEPTLMPVHAELGSRGGDFFCCPVGSPDPHPPFRQRVPRKTPHRIRLERRASGAPTGPPSTAPLPASLPAPTAAPTPLPRGPACATALAPPASPPAAHCRLSPGSGPQPLRSKPSSSSSRPSSPQSRARRRAGCRPPESIGSSSCVFAGVRVARVARCASSPLSPSMTRACGGAAPRARYDCLPGP